MSKTYHLNILGSRWKLKVIPRSSDPMFGAYDGYTDRSIRTIYVADSNVKEAEDMKDWESYLKIVKRHEIIHAFLVESGLAQDMSHPDYGHDEQSIDWMAIQFPKMIEAFQKAEAL